jgi:hypothetical protein
VVGATGVTAVEASDATEVPAALVAVTVKVYRVPLVRPVMRQVSGPLVHMHVFPSGDDVTV